MANHPQSVRSAQPTPPTVLQRISQPGANSMTVTIRKLDNTEHEYFAYCKSLCGKATYLLYFDDSILGAVVLHNFIEMLRSFFDLTTIKVVVSDNTVSPKNQLILDQIRE